MEINNLDNISSFGKAQLVLAEKRTSLAVLRTGIMIFALPMTILTALIALSRFYDLGHTLWLLIPIVTISTGLFFFAMYLIYRSFFNIIKLDRLLYQLRQSDPEISDLIPK